MLIRKQFWKFTTILVMGWALTVMVILFAPRKFASSAKLLIKLGSENVTLDPTAASTGQPTQVIRTSQDEITTVTRMMRSRTTLEKVVDQITPDVLMKGYLPNETGVKKESWGTASVAWAKRQVGALLASIDPISNRERAIILLEKGLKIEAEKLSSVVDVSYSSKSPGLSLKVVKTWIDEYRKDHAEMNLLQGSYDFLLKEEIELEEKLKAARSELKKMKTACKIVSVEGWRETLDAELQWANSSYIANRAKLDGVIARVEDLEKQLNRTPDSVVLDELKLDTNETMTAMRDRLYQLEIEERSLAAKYSKSHPKYIEVFAQLRDARALIDAESKSSSQSKTGINPLYQLLIEQLSLAKAEMVALNSEADSMLTILTELEQKTEAFNTQEAELLQLRSRIEVLEAEYRSHHSRREQAHSAEQLRRSEVSNVVVIQQPSLQERPTSPNKPICAVLGFLGSFALAFGTIALYEMQQVALNDREHSDQTLSVENQG